MGIPVITIIGGGLAGSEAAWQLSRLGLACTLYEMRPPEVAQASTPAIQVAAALQADSQTWTPAPLTRQTPAHKTGLFAELVCSNSLKSEQVNSAPWLLKEELRRLDSLLLKVAAETAVPAGHALAVDREVFAQRVTAALESQPLIRIRREEVREIPATGTVIVATGPLTSDALAESIQQLTGSGRLYFYDAISPIVEADSLDRTKIFPASRYGKQWRAAAPADGRQGGRRREESSSNAPLAPCHAPLSADEDYWNCYLTREEYQHFYQALVTAESYPLHEFERACFFEACLPLEELARRGPDTLRFGPMKPVGLCDPRIGHMPYAAVQLRRENLRADSFNLVGFQNHMRFGDQARVLRLIPGLENAVFLRYGQIHRNTYINGPALLDETLALKSRPEVFFAGQISGVEGYVESIATGLLAARHAARRALGQAPLPLPRETALGSLCHYITHANPAHYQPANITFDLLPPIEGRDKQLRRATQCQRALQALDRWKREQENPQITQMTQI